MAESRSGPPFPVTTRIPSPHGPIPTYVAEPSALGPHPAVIIIHDVFGADPDLTAQADWLAGAGFLAVAPDLFHHGGKIGCIRRAIQDLRERKGRAFLDVEAVRGWAAADPRCSGQVGVIGFCMGGGFALLMAALYPYAAASVNYGQVPKDPEEVLAGSCPLVGSYGGRDRTLRGAAPKLEQALTQLGIPHDVREYPAAGHGFMNQHTGFVPTVIAKIGGIGYEGSAAEDARRRIVAFFDEHLRALPATD